MLLILTGARMHWYDKILKRHVCKRSSIKLGHRWTDLSNISSSHSCSSLHDSQIEMFYILIAIIPSIDQTLFLKEKKNVSILWVYIFTCCFTTAEQFACKTIAVKLWLYWSLMQTSLNTCIHILPKRHGRVKKMVCLRSNTYTMLNPLVSSADVYIPSSEYNTDKLIALEAPSLPLISLISRHTHT